MRENAEHLTMTNERSSVQISEATHMRRGDISDWARSVSTPFGSALANACQPLKARRPDVRWAYSPYRPIDPLRVRCLRSGPARHDAQAVHLPYLPLEAEQNKSVAETIEKLDRNTREMDACFAVSARMAVRLSQLAPPSKAPVAAPKPAPLDATPISVADLARLKARVGSIERELTEEGKLDRAEGPMTYPWTRDARLWAKRR